MASFLKRYTPQLFASDYENGTKPPLYFWYPPGTTKKDKWFLHKIDSTILIYGCLSYWVKYLDQSNLSNAYVTGMKEDLGIEGNEFTEMNTMFTVGTSISQIPSNLLLTKLPPRLWLVGCELVWGVLTLLLFTVHNVRQIYALRFLIGFLEGTCFVGMQYILGSWYMKRELGKRTAIFACCAYAGSMFSGFIQSGVQSSMNGRLGHAGWRWLFVIDACLTFFVVIFGFVFFPDTPTTTKAWYLTAEEKEYAVERFRSERPLVERNKFEWNIFKRVFLSWQFWVLIPVWIGWSNTPGKYAGTIFPLFLKAKHFTVYQINNIPTSVSGWNIIIMMVTAFIIDITGRRLLVIYCLLTLQIVGTIILVCGSSVSLGGTIFGIIAACSDGPTSPIIMTWANILMYGDAQVRALTIACMNAFGSAVSTIVNQFLYKATTAPYFHKGVSASLGFLFLELVFVTIIRFIELHLRSKATVVEEGVSEDDLSEEVHSEKKQAIEA